MTARPRILLAEDDRFLRVAGEATLHARRAGHHVEQCGPGRRQLEILDDAGFDAASAEIRAAAIAGGMKTMFQDALAKLFLGETTIEAVARATA